MKAIGTTIFYGIVGGMSFFVGCTVKPKKIDYGNASCHYCKMTIVDKIHASEIVTQKSKVYTFDSMECMIYFIRTFDTPQIKMYLTNTYTHPGTLIDATKATFLISEEIPSPMGAFLTAFETAQDAAEIQKETGGKTYTWKKLLSHLQ